MDVISDGIVDESVHTLGHVYDILTMDNSPLRNLSVTCALCHRIFTSDNELSSIDAISMCGDCKFLLLEDVEAISPYDHQRRSPESRRRRHGSSMSDDSLFSQQFSRMITLERQAQAMAVEHETLFENNDGTGRLVQRTSAHTTPSGSMRWRRVFSDTESDGFDSVYAESEPYAGFRGDGNSHGESDSVSYSVYGGESDTSVDDRSFLDIENAGQLDGGSDLESDTDIDPMNAGLYPWNSDDEDEDDYSGWNESLVQRNLAGSSRTGIRLHSSLMLDGNDQGRPLWSREVQDSIRPRISVRTQEPSAGPSNSEESRTRNYVGNSGNYLASRGFENLLEHLSETENSRKGAPPAAISFIKNMARLRIDGQHDNLDNLSCAICKESLVIGTVVNQLPCFHIYHPSCILPWITARNTCPLCRYELPTDDKDYEERQRSRGSRYEMLRIYQHNINEDNSQGVDDPGADELSQLLDDEEQEEQLVDENPNSENCVRDVASNRWLSLAAAAAPIVSVLGISLMIWLGKSSTCRWQAGHAPYRRENSQRRWWPLF